MGAAGGTIGALISEKPYKERAISFFVGFILSVSLSDYTAMFLTGGKCNIIFHQPLESNLEGFFFGESFTSLKFHRSRFFNFAFTESYNCGKLGTL